MNGAELNVETEKCWEHFSFNVEFYEQVREFIRKYQPVFGLNLSPRVLIELALYCFMEDVKEGRMDIIGLADTFGFGDEQLELTPTEVELNRKLEGIKKGGL